MIKNEQLAPISIPEAPEIPGLWFRHFQEETDFSFMAKVNRECNKVDHVGRSIGPEDLKCWYMHMPNCDLYRDVIFAELDGEMVGYGRVSWRQELDGARVYSHAYYLAPAWQKKGIGWALMKYQQGRLKDISDKHPEDGERFYESFAADTEKAKKELLIKDGYKTARHFFEMVRPHLDDIPQAPMPEGLEVREVKPEHYQAIYESSLEAFQDHWGFSEAGEPTVEAWLDNPSFDPSLWKIAWDGDQVVGMVRSFIDRKENEEYNRKRGWTEDICVRRPWRKRGLARSLIVQSLYAIKERGMTEAALGVDTDNPQGALQLYQSVGFKPDKQFSAYQKPF